MNVVSVLQPRIPLESFLRKSPEKSDPCGLSGLPGSCGGAQPAGDGPRPLQRLPARSDFRGTSPRGPSDPAARWRPRGLGICAFAQTQLLLWPGLNLRGQGCQIKPMQMRRPICFPVSSCCPFICKWLGCCWGREHFWGRLCRLRTGVEAGVLLREERTSPLSKLAEQYPPKVLSYRCRRQSCPLERTLHLLFPLASPPPHLSLGSLSKYSCIQDVLTEGGAGENVIFGQSSDH